MIPRGGQLARFWKNDQAEWTRAFQERIVFDIPLNRKTSKEPRRG
jgi:hypothetical protein